MTRPDYVEANPKIAMAVARAISRGGALFHSKPEEAKAALRNHRLGVKLDESVFDLSYNMVAGAMPAWGTMSRRGLAKGHQLRDRRGYCQRGPSSFEQRGRALDE